MEIGPLPQVPTLIPTGRQELRIGAGLAAGLVRDLDFLSSHGLERLKIYRYVTYWYYTILLTE